MKNFDDEWRDWIARNVQEGCPKDILFKVLHDSGFRYDAIRSELDHEPVMPLDRIFQPLAKLDEVAIHGRREEAQWEELIEPRPSIERPDRLAESVRTQQERIPYLGAGGPACRGFEKRRLEPEIHDEITRRFDSARRNLQVEGGDAIGTYIGTVNPFLPPTLVHLDLEFNRVLLELMKPLHEQWCGFPLEPAACYGFRVYLSGAYLHAHVDREHTHVISSTLCVDRFTHSPWPLQAEDIDGTVHEVECEPGEFVLYESARIAHGRPVPMNGRFHAALFLHYRPAENWELWRESPLDWYAQLRR